MKIKEEHYVKDWTRFVGTLVIGIILIAAISVWAGTIFGSHTETIASTTITSIDVTTITSSAVSSYTMTSIVVRTTESLVTITQQGPDMIQISGGAKTATIGTTPVSIIFISASRNNNTQFPATVTNGEFKAVLPNRDYYNVKITYTTAVGGVGSGSCIAGSLILFILDAKLLSNWAC